MSDAYIILDSEEEEDEQQHKVAEAYDNESENEQAIDTFDIEDEIDKDDEPLFDKHTTRKSQSPPTKQSNQKRDSYSLYLDDLKASKSTPTPTPSPSPSPPPLSPSPSPSPSTTITTKTSYQKKKSDSKASQYAKFLGDSSSEEDDNDLPPLIKKTQPQQQRKRTLKNPIPRKREKSMDFVVDDDEEVEMEERNERENSLDLLIETSQKITESPMDLGESSVPSRGKRSLRNPIPKRKDSLDELLDRHTSSASLTVNKTYDKTKKKTQDHLFSDDELELEMETDKMSYKKKTTQGYLSDSDGDDMGTTAKSVPRQKQTQSSSSSGLNKSASYKVDSINLLSDDSEKEEEEKEKVQVNRNNKYDQNKRNPSTSPPRKLKRSSLFHPKEKSDSFFFDDDEELNKTKQDRPLSRKNSVDDLLESTSSLVPSRSPSPAPPALDAMTRQRPKLSMQKLVYGSDSSPENSPTLQPTKIKKKVTKSKNSGKHKKPIEDDTNYDVDDFAELHERDLEIEEAFSRLPTRREKSKEQDSLDANGNKSKSNSPSNITISIDDSDDDNNGGGIEADSFFDDLMSLPKKRNRDTPSTSTSKKQKVSSHRSLESVASSSKPIIPMSSYRFDDDDDDDNGLTMDQEEPVLTDRKGKKRAVEHNYSYDFNDRVSENNSQMDEDTLTPKEKRHLESLKKKEEAQRKREEKQKQKEKQKLEKERALLYEKANKIKSNRTEVVKEMIVDMHPSFISTKTGQIIKDVFESSETQVKTLNEEKYCHTMSWRRKCTAEWDVDSQSFIPLDKTTLIDEPFVLIYFEWVPFIQHIVDNTLDEFLQRVKKSCPDKQVLLMIEGLDVYYRKRTLVESRKFQQAVRQSISNGEDDTSATATSSSTSKRKKTTSSVYLIDVGPSRMKVEELLVQLQMMDDIMLIPTKDDGDSASWLKSLTIDIALGRYKSKNLNNTYRVSKTGQGASDSFSKMLQEIHLCTPAIANSVMSAYPTAQSLYQAYKKTSRGDILLADLQVERSTVHSRDRTINNVMSKKIYTIFTSTDPDHVIF